MPQVSVIIPVFDEEQNISVLYDDLSRYLSGNDEIIFVDDGSRDNTFSEINKLASFDQRVKCISLSRNFGHQNAIVAGLQYSKGDYTITMDGDMQHPPQLIPSIVQKLDEGNDIVITRRTKTEEISAIKKFFSRLFYRFINAISDTRIEPGSSDFRGFNRKALNSILQFSEREIFLRGIVSWIGFRSATITFDAPKRKYGKTKYSFGKMIKLGLKGVTAFSFKPLRVAVFIGSLISLAAFAFAVYALIAYFRGVTVPGWASTIIAIMFLGGTQLLAIGLLGEYIASLFIETKNRPLYLVDKKINLD